MDFRSTILDYAARFETHLADKYGATGRGLHEKVTSVEGHLPSWLAGQLRFVATMRNKAVHESGFEPDDPDGVLKTCKKIEIDFDLQPHGTATVAQATQKTIPVASPPDEAISFARNEGITISDGQLHSPKGIFLLSDIKSVRVDENAFAKQRWITLISCLVYASIFRGWFGSCVLIGGFWIFYFAREYAVQIATSSGWHTLASFFTLIVRSEKIDKQSHAILTLISHHLAARHSPTPPA